MPEEKGNIILKYMIILAIYTAIAGAILGITYNITEPKRIANAGIAEDKSRGEVLTAAAKFQQAKINGTSFYKGFDQKNSLSAMS